MPESTSENSSLTACVLASGSKGNSFYISTGNTALLLDAGLSGIQLERRLQSRGICPRSLDAILVSHEHIDHIRGVGVFSRRFNLPVLINKKTAEAAARKIGRIERFSYFDCGKSFRVKDLTIHPFSISHDASDPAGFTFSRNGVKIGVATDLGIPTHMVKTHLQGCGLLVIEANHDLSMLENGPYPWPLKQRIKSRVGHLSNDTSRHLLTELLHDRLSHVILAHLSEINNDPKVALEAIRPVLKNHPARLHVAVQDTCGKLFNL